ncbi:MAG: flagellar biosynthetic protein FliO [Arthrobacter sp.]
MDMLILGLRVVLSLAVVLGLVWVIQRRFGSGTGSAGVNPVAVVGRRGVGTKASVVVVETEGKRFVLGVTEAAITLIHSGEAAPASPTAETFDQEIRKAEAKSPDLLVGSILSMETWKHAASAIRNGPAR